MHEKKKPIYHCYLIFEKLKMSHIFYHLDIQLLFFFNYHYSVLSQALTFVFHNWYFPYKLLLHCLPYLDNVSIVSLKIAVQVSIYIKAFFIIPDQLLTYMTHLKISKTHFRFSIEKKATTSLEECFFLLMSMTFFHDKIDSDLFFFFT